jgi:uncharacterized protein YndB with AHSA1/START domain
LAVEQQSEASLPLTATHAQSAAAVSEGHCRNIQLAKFEFMVVPDAGVSRLYPLSGLRGNPRPLIARWSDIMSKKKPEPKKAPTRTNSVRLHRVFAAKPGKVYRAFLEADAVAKWMPPFGFTCKVEHLDAKVGGKFRMSFRNFTTGHEHSFGGEYLELAPDELIRYTDRFDDPNLPGTIHVTVTLKAVSVGTEINIEQTDLPAAIPPEACYLGWQQSLAQLAQLVEPEIPG